MERLDLVVGPNGAGKSTFIAFTLAPLLPGSPVVNADEIARQRWPGEAAGRAYEAAQVAADTRAKLIDLGRSFIAETVFSHPSKLDLIHTAHRADFTVVLHAMLIPEDLAVERVRHRVRAGGHDVPETKVRERHRRLWTPVAQALALSDVATVYDNSRLRGPRIVARLSGGMTIGRPDWPAWAPEILQKRWTE
ncbi:AAA family ATPase [Mycobacterium sp. WUMAC-067]|uniref:AAA family ATPase n=1 Tax=unclassified Mycobacterium TaxID=2642494 RepID=UPI001CD95ED4|nr:MULTISPECIES: AAA family ATPase [unclassified Mycobacterium]MCA2244351.1 AAA family ATPase [Mycobacterium sp. WUMAC-067]MCA2313502.1 AAA family ATPase [Mycobacterium sp. WUMAC-025]